jgi:DNA-binding GntR family transcriptional regulator
VQLARRIGIGRTPLREALRMLQHEGLIEAEYNRRVRVAPFSIGDLEQLYALRVMEEAVGIRLTVPRLSESELTLLDDLLDEMDVRAGGDFELWEATHERFHRLLVSHAGTRIVHSISRLADHAQRYRRYLLERAPISYAIGAEEHRAIVRACHARDAQLAGELLARHLGRTALSFVSLIDPGHDPVTVREALRCVIGDAAQPTPFEADSVDKRNKTVDSFPDLR